MHTYTFKPHTPPLPQSRTSGKREGVCRPGAIRLWFRTAIRNWKRRKMFATLQRMDDHLLRDIGIERGDIARVVDSFTDRELGMRPVSSEVEREETRCIRPAT